MADYLKSARVQKHANGEYWLRIHSGDLSADFNLSAMAGELSALDEENVIQRTLDAWYADQDKGNGKN